MPLPQTLLSNIVVQSLENFVRYITWSSTFLIDCLINYLRQQTTVLCELIIKWHSSWCMCFMEEFLSDTAHFPSFSQFIKSSLYMKQVKENSDKEIAVRMQQRYKKFYGRNNFQFSPIFFDIFIFNFALSIKVTVRQRLCLQ